MMFFFAKEELVNNLLFKALEGQQLRHYKSAAAPQATEDGVTILTGTGPADLG